MVKYYYNKYNTTTVTVYNEPSTWTYNGDAQYVVMSGRSKGYTFNKNTNKYTLSGDIWGASDLVPAGSIGYSLDSSEEFINKHVTKQQNYGNIQQTAEWYSKATRDSTTSSEYVRGALVQSNIIAENGTYPTNGRHTDGFWYVRGSIANQNPVITPSSAPSGTYETKPSFNYNVSDPDGNPMTITEAIDGIIFNTRTGVASGTQLSFTPTDLAWLRTRIKQTVNITITADDGHGGVTTVNYPITRTTPAIELQLKTPFETDVAAKRLLLKLEGSIPGDAVVNVQACNNAFDASPTWENATNLVLSGFPYPFNNTVKTAAKWGISFKIRIERGSSTQSIYLDGVGGAFD